MHFSPIPIAELMYSKRIILPYMMETPCMADLNMATCLQIETRNRFDRKRVIKY